MNVVERAALRASARTVPRAELAAALGARLGELGAPRESLAAARRIAEPRSVVVVAGQQPVLLGGPGLVWAKAVDALALAGAIEDRTGLPAVAVFWNASEDHDHAECDHVRMDLGSEVETLRAPLPGDRRMLSRVEVPAEARALVESLRVRFPRGPSREQVLAALAPAPGDSMGSWFSRILLRVLGGAGLVVVEPDTLRPFARAVADREVARPGELAAAIARDEAAALARGEGPALALSRPELLFLLDGAGRRLRVAHDAGAWRVEDGRAIPSAEMAALAPAACSWNVAARVLAQDVALPVAAQVCGPSEMRYAARLGAAHAALGVDSPALVRRSTWEFFPPRALRLCADLGIEWTGVRGLRGAAADAPTPAEEPPHVRDLREAVARLPAGGSAAVQRRRSGLARGVDAYAQALRDDARERAAAGAARRRRLLDLLAPEGEDQDRRLSPLPWLARVGLGWLADQVRAQRSRAPALAPDGETRGLDVVVMVPPHAEEANP